MKTAQFEGLVKRASRAYADAAAAAGDKARIATGAPVAYRSCPECSEMMHCRNFERISGVGLDECRSHGRWLDHGELEAIARFLASGALTKARERDQLSAERARDVARQEAFLAGVTPGSANTPRQNLVDVMAIGGYYALLAMLLNVARTQLPEGKQPGMPHFPN